MSFKEFFTAQMVRDEESRKEVIPLLGTILLVTILVIPVVLGLRLLDGIRFNTTDYALMALLLCLCVYYYFLKKGWLLLVSLLFIITAWIAITVMAGYSGGIRDITIIGYILLILLSTFLTGYRFSIILALLSIISFWTMAIAEYKNLFIPFNDPPLIYARDFTIFIILVLAGIIMVERSFRYSFQRITKELQERKKAEEQLSINEHKLIESNVELNNSYERIVKMNLDLIAAKEKAEESDRLKTSFLRNISHEIRTPMNGIVGFAEILESTELSDEEKNDFIKVIVERANHLAKLINDLIDISKLDAGDIQVINQKFTVSELFNDIKTIFAEQAHEKGLDLILISELDNVMISDFGKISKVLNNLVSNSLKFTAKGSVRIDAAREAGKLLIKVTDTGIGIESGHLPVIFDRFVQAEIGLNRSYGGCGLGLSISKAIVEFLGGTISAKSEAGKGAVLTFSVPVVFLSDMPLITLDELELNAGQKLNILIAEDDVINSMFLKELFRDRNCTLFFAVNGIEAVDIIKRNSEIDIVLMDLKMPEMDGYEAAKIIKRLSPRLPIIALTAFALEQDKMRASTEHFSDYIVKPFDRKNLFQRIEKAVFTPGHSLN